MCTNVSDTSLGVMKTSLCKILNFTLEIGLLRVLFNYFSKLVLLQVLHDQNDL